MKKSMIMAISVLLLAACTKESMQGNANKADALSAKSSTKQGARVTRPITNSLQSDPDPSLPPLPCGVGGGVLFYGNMDHLGKVHGNGVNKTCSLTSDGKVNITSEDIAYAANGDQLWTKGSIFVTFPTDGSAIATITGGSIIVGGTGRFEGATGYFIYENMTANLVTGHESHTAYGEITY
jgi:hypothetical protein